MSTNYIAAIRVTTHGDGFSLDEYLHEAHEIAASMNKAVIAEWGDHEHFIDPIGRCRCARCAGRNEHQIDKAAW